MVLVLEDPLAGDHVGAGWPGYEAPCVVVDERMVLLSHCRTPVWISQTAMVVGGKWRRSGRCREAHILHDRYGPGLGPCNASFWLDGRCRRSCRRRWLLYRSSSLLDRGRRRLSRCRSRSWCYRGSVMRPWTPAVDKPDVPWDSRWRGSWSRGSHWRSCCWWSSRKYRAVEQDRGVVGQLLNETGM